MADIGFLKVENREGKVHATGNIRSFSLTLASIVVEPAKDQRTEKSPTHDVLARTKSGAFIKIGVAWVRLMTRGDHAGKPMISMSLDDPALPDWCSNLTAFPRGDDGGYSIIHERQRRDASAPATELAEQLDDEVPHQ